MGLDAYRAKRDFSKTAEPAGRQPPSEDAGRRFVIHKHDASRLHYDLRLEVAGVLASWAVPKGPSLDPGVRRLAVRVEDHPLEYGGFEGVIPEGEYGGGTVMLWDRGVYEMFKPGRDPVQALREGNVHLRFHGQKMRGEWMLTQMHGPRSEDGKNWLLIKVHGDNTGLSGGDEALLGQDRSVASGRSMAEITADHDRVWSSSQGEVTQAASEPAPEPVASEPDATVPVDPPTPGPPALAPADLPGARRARLPRHPDKLKVQLATLSQGPPAGENWLHEIKYDGYRLLAVVEKQGVRLITRGGKDWSERFPTIVTALSAAGLPPCLLDGEAVVEDSGGISDFQALQNVLSGISGGRLLYRVFDLLHCGGYDLTRVGQLQRKDLLARLLAPLPEDSPVRFTEHIQGNGADVYAQACRLGLEGIVSKRGDSGYTPRRTRNWLKVKCLNRQEFVIGGWSDPQGSRSGFGALYVGVHDAQGHLVYAGKVGTGFTEQSLDELSRELEGLAVNASPFVNPPRGREGALAHWVRPELVAEVAYTEKTAEGLLRHPSFRGLRRDKDPREVVAETAEPPQSIMPDDPNTPEKDIAMGQQDQQEQQDLARFGVALSHPDRVLYPEVGVTKEDLAAYYAAVAEQIMPHIADRPLVLVRCPDGRHAECFYQKHPAGALSGSLGEHVRTLSLPEKHGTDEYMYVQDIRGILALVQFGVLEFHVWGSHVDRPERPDMLVMDLDPGPGVAWEQVLAGARRMRAILEQLGLTSFAKLTGGKGVHVVAPFERRVSWDELKEFAHDLSLRLEREDPGLYVSQMPKAKRKGRIFVDYLRNSRGATAVASFSTRARPGAPVAVPVRWDELSPSTPPNHYNVGNIRQRLAALSEDPWHGYFELRQRLTATMRRELAKSLKD